MEIEVGKLYKEKSDVAWAMTAEVVKFNKETGRVTFKDFNGVRSNTTLSAARFRRQYEEFFKAI